MTLVSDAAEALEAALRTVPGLRVYTDVGAAIDPPGAVVGPPSLTWGSVCAEPSSATFLVAVVVAMDDRAMPRLWELVPQVATALETVSDAVVRRATPDVWTSGTANLPSYAVFVEMSL